MLNLLLTRLKQGHRTMPYPEGPPPPLPDRFRGAPTLRPTPGEDASCPPDCAQCVEACPTHAIALAERGPRFDLGRCLFCTDCIDACPTGALTHGTDWRLSTRTRQALLTDRGSVEKLAALDDALKRLFGRSLKLRQVSAGGCGGCEADVNVLSTVGWDLARFGIQIVASPRHADGVLITGCVSEHMRQALRDTYDAIPSPRVVIAVGACAISGGPFAGSPAQHDGATELLPIDLFIPGCPPHPLTILDGLLGLMGRLEGALP